MDWASYASPIGTIGFAADEKGIRCIRFLEKAEELTIEGKRLNPHLARFLRECDAYFEGRLKRFQTPLLAAGTPFQLRVWDALARIPYGETRTYGQIAQAIGSPLAARAIGMANNRNPLPIAIPCHRVIGASGQLVGYAGEIWRKKWLLKREGVALAALSQPETPHDSPRLL